MDLPIEKDILKCYRRFSMDKVDIEVVKRLGTDHEFAIRYLHILVSAFADTGTLRYLKEGIALIELVKQEE